MVPTGRKLALRGVVVVCLSQSQCLCFCQRRRHSRHRLSALAAAVLMAADESSKLTRLEAAVATLKDTGVSAAALRRWNVSSASDSGRSAASRVADVDRFGRKKPTAAPPPPLNGRQRQTSLVHSSIFWRDCSTLAEQRERANRQAELRRRAAAEAAAAAAARQAAEAALALGAGVARPQGGVRGRGSQAAHGGAGGG